MADRLPETSEARRSLVKDVVFEEDDSCVAGLARSAQLHKAGLNVPAGAAGRLVEVHDHLQQGTVQCWRHTSQLLHLLYTAPAAFLNIELQ